MRIIFLLVILFFQTGCFAENQQVIKQQPRLNDPYTWDFGRVKAGEVLKHDFIFKNDSPKAINIQNVNTSCGCTVSEVKKNNLLPGEETLIVVKFNSKNYSGQVQQYVYVQTDNLENSMVRFIIKANVEK